MQSSPQSRQPPVLRAGFLQWVRTGWGAEATPAATIVLGKCCWKTCGQDSSAVRRVLSAGCLCRSLPARAASGPGAREAAVCSEPRPRPFWAESYLEQLRQRRLEQVRQQQRNKLQGAKSPSTLWPLAFFFLLFFPPVQ